MSRNKSKDVNSRCTLINNTENETLFRMLGPNCLTLSSGVVQLFLADSSSEQWNKHFCGIACFVKDSNQRSYFIRIFDIKREQMVWQQELYQQFRYKAPRDFLHTFEADSCQAALNFASEDEAMTFKNIVDQKLTERHQRRMNRKSKMAPRAAVGGNARAPPTVQNNAAPVQSSVSKVNTGASKAAQNVGKKTDKGKKDRLTKQDIGSPSNFIHVNHVGFDPNKGLEMDKLDPDMKRLFQSVGIKHDDNIDKDTMEFIYDFVDKRGGLDAVKKEMAVTPPPPPITRAAAPQVPGRQAQTAPRPRPPAPSTPATPPPPPPSRRVGAPTPPRPPAHSSRGAPPPTPRDFPPPPPHCKGGPPAPPPPPPPPPAVGGPPPPPPPPCGAPPPPPPPPPPVSDAPAGGRGNLLSQIQQGMELKKISSDSRPSNARGDLLDAIKGGSATLKRVDGQQERAAPQLEDDGGLVGALAQALSKRKTFIQGMNDDDDSGDEDDFDDEEWD